MSAFAQAEAGAFPRFLPTWLEQAFHACAIGIEVIGVAVIVVGAVWATVVFFLELLRRQEHVEPYDDYRANLGRAILLGLEFLVGADIIRTVAVEPTLASLSSLGLIVLIRTFLSFALETEIHGRPPWRRSPPPAPHETTEPRG